MLIVREQDRVDRRQVGDSQRGAGELVRRRPPPEVVVRPRVLKVGSVSNRQPSSSMRSVGPPNG